MQQMQHMTAPTPAGLIELFFDAHFIYQATFIDRPSISCNVNNTLSRQIEAELQVYFNDPKHPFQLPLKPQGTPFQQRVWSALLHVPASTTVTYGALAKQLETSPRAIGQACRTNPITLFIPCHRVVGKTSQGGYMGSISGLKYKDALLKHEAI